MLSAFFLCLWLPLTELEEGNGSCYGNVEAFEVVVQGDAEGVIALFEDAGADAFGLVAQDECAALGPVHVEDALFSVCI